MTAKIDLHLHSTASDGKLTPKQLIDRALEKGIPAIALTDHNTAEGLRFLQFSCSFYAVKCMIPICATFLSQRFDNCKLITCFQVRSYWQT